MNDFNELEFEEDEEDLKVYNPIVSLQFMFDLPETGLGDTQTNLLLDTLRQASLRQFYRGTRTVRKIIGSTQRGRWNENDEELLNGVIGEICDLFEKEDILDVMLYVKENIN